MYLKKHVIGRAACAAWLALAAGSACALDLHGYFRSGPGQKSNEHCYGSGFAGGTYRLGNECDTYGEFALSHAGQAQGVDYKAVVGTYVYKGGSSEPGGDQLKLWQLYGEVKGLDFAPGLSFWAGKREFGLADVHIVDTKFVRLIGTGAGVEGIRVGSGKLGLSVFRDDESPVNKGSRFNADLQGIPVNLGGTLRITATATRYNGPGGERGYGLSLQHNQAQVLGGDNTLWLQYAAGSADLNGMFGPATRSTDDGAVRLVESLQWTRGPLTGQAIAMVGKEEAGSADIRFNTLGGRAGYAFGRNFKLQAELGHSNRKPSGQDTETLTKLTIAPTLTIGPDFYDRPELRLYYTAARWNAAYAAANARGTARSGHSAGLQLEMWF